MVFALSRGGADGADLTADLLVVGAVLAPSWCYVEGAAVSREMPGWQVISWLVVQALPVPVPWLLALWFTARTAYDPTAVEWFALIGLGVSSMYLGFFAWYRGLALAGIARGGQVQQLQAPLTLVWSAWWLGETVTVGTVVAALAVIGCVVGAARVADAGGGPRGVIRAAWHVGAVLGLSARRRSRRAPVRPRRGNGLRACGRRGSGGSRRS